MLGRRVDPAVDRVELDGVPLPVQPGLVHYLVNKPAGVVSTAEDTHGRPTVVSLVPDDPRVFPVGRLDMDIEGLLILTNDGDLTHRLTHPSFGVPKEYLVQVEGEPTAGEVRRLREGVELDDGPTAPARVAVVAPDPAAHRHPRGSQPADPPDVRGGRPPGGPAGPDPDRAARRSLAEPGVPTGPSPSTRCAAWPRRPCRSDRGRPARPAGIGRRVRRPLSNMPG